MESNLCDSGSMTLQNSPLWFSWNSVSRFGHNRLDYVFLICSDSESLQSSGSAPFFELLLEYFEVVSQLFVGLFQLLDLFLVVHFSVLKPSYGSPLPLQDVFEKSWRLLRLRKVLVVV